MTMLRKPVSDKVVVTVTDPTSHKIICSTSVSGDCCDKFIATIKEEIYPDHLITVDYPYSRQMELFR